MSMQLGQQTGTMDEHLALMPQTAAEPGGDKRQRSVEKARQEIFRRFRRGESVESLAERFGRSATSVYQVVTEMRFQRILQLPLDYIPSEEFDRIESDEEEEKKVLAPTPASGRPTRKIKPPSSLPPYLASLYDVPLLTREQEVHLFRKMNYLKHKARHLRHQLDPRQPSVEIMDQIEKMYHRSVAAKNELLRANLRLVVSVAKRYAKGPENLFELISDGNMSLIRAVEKFDYMRGFKFSTYATWALVKNYARTIPEEQRHQTRFRAHPEEWLVTTQDRRGGQFLQEMADARRRKDVARILNHLTDREKQLIGYRFGLQDDQEPMTLREVGERMGVTKERVRQLEARAIAKLRKAAEEERIEAPNGG